MGSEEGSVRIGGKDERGSETRRDERAEGREKDRSRSEPWPRITSVAVRDDRAANSARKIDSLDDIHPNLLPFLARSISLSRSLVSLRAPGTPLIFAALYTRCKVTIRRRESIPRRYKPVHAFPLYGMIALRVLGGMQNPTSVPLKLFGERWTLLAPTNLNATDVMGLVDVFPDRRSPPGNARKVTVQSNKLPEWRIRRKTR